MTRGEGKRVREKGRVSEVESKEGRESELKRGRGRGIARERKIEKARQGESKLGRERSSRSTILHH